MLKNILIVLALFLGTLTACHKHHDPKPHGKGGCNGKDSTAVKPVLADSTCSTLVTAKNFAGLDGCGWMFVLEDGTRLIPIFLPTFAPIALTEGQQFKISYKIKTDVMTVCMAGKTADIFCMTEIKNN